MEASKTFPIHTQLEGVQYIRITGSAGREGQQTITNLDQLTNDEIVTALVTLCNYATELEHEVDALRRAIHIAEEMNRGLRIYVGTR